MSKKLPIIVGPTGVGKSEVAYHLALKLQAEIISADAFQVFKCMEIGTAQPSAEHQKRVHHHLTGIRDPDQSWNAVEFARQAKKIIEECTLRGKKVLIVGGAGFYLRALVSGAPEGEAPDLKTRDEVQAKVKELGNEKAHQWLAEKDPQAAHRIHVNDTMRITRALEKSLSRPSPHSHSTAPVDYLPLGEQNVLFLGLERSRDHLDELLKARAQAMWEGGLLEETKALMIRKLPETSTLWGAIGYLEAAAFLRGEITQAEALEKLFRRSRQYAKRQWTWFKHQHDVKWFNLDNYPDVPSVVRELETRITLGE